MKDLSIIIKKIKYYIISTIYLVIDVLAIPFVIFIRILQPVITIRLGRLDFERIGNLYNGEFYLLNKTVEQDNFNKIDFFYFIGPICNQFWFRLWKKK